jgi:predicted kinase
MFTLGNFYKSKEWENLIEQLRLERINENGQLICAHCGKPISRKYDCIGHHVIELNDANVNDYNVSLNKANIVLVHHRCHNAIHERWGFEKPKQVWLIYGSPCAGKSTWVKENAGKDDLILDVDSIYECISINDKYHKNDRIKANVFGIRDCILNQIQMRLGKWKNAYIIGGYPLNSDRQRLIDKLGCIPIFIDTDKETCMKRAKNDEWKSYIDDWFDSFIP